VLCKVYPESPERVENRATLPSGPLGCKSERGDLPAAPFRHQVSSLELELQSKLNQPWIIGCGNTTEVDAANVSIRITEVDMIEDIEELRSEFNDLVLADLRSFQQRYVEVDVARSMEHIATEATESSAASGQ